MLAVVVVLVLLWALGFMTSTPSAACSISCWWWRSCSRS